MSNYMLIRRIGSLQQMLGVYSSEIEVKFIMNRVKKHIAGKVWYKISNKKPTSTKVGSYLRIHNGKNDTSKSDTKHNHAGEQLSCL